MIVCHCRAVNDATIRVVINSGASSELEVAAACSAGTDCGGCLPAISQLLDECLGCPLRVGWEPAHGAAVA